MVKFYTNHHIQNPVVSELFNSYGIEGGMEDEKKQWSIDVGITE